MFQLLYLGILIFIAFTALIIFLTRYKRCPSDKILVIYGKTGKGSAKCVAGGAYFADTMPRVSEQTVPLSMELI